MRFSWDFAFFVLVVAYSAWRKYDSLFSRSAAVFALLAFPFPNIFCLASFLWWLLITGMVSEHINSPRFIEVTKKIDLPFARSILERRGKPFLESDSLHLLVQRIRQDMPELDRTDYLIPMRLFTSKKSWLSYSLDREPSSTKHWGIRVIWYKIPWLAHFPNGKPRLEDYKAELLADFDDRGVIGHTTDEALLTMSESLAQTASAPSSHDWVSQAVFFLSTAHTLSYLRLLAFPRWTAIALWTGMLMDCCCWLWDLPHHDYSTLGACFICFIDFMYLADSKIWSWRKAAGLPGNRWNATPQHQRAMIGVFVLLALTHWLLAPGSKLLWWVSFIVAAVASVSRAMRAPRQVPE
jgi:hypothetical protein